MTKPLSPDLHICTIQAVEVEGMSCRAAAGRFGVAPSTAVELLRQMKARADIYHAAPGRGYHFTALNLMHSSKRNGGFQTSFSTSFLLLNRIGLNCD
jgi:hypothetical protein